MKKQIAMLLLPLIFLGGCSILQKTENFSSEKSAQIGEALLPQDVLFLAKFSTEDETEYNNYKELKEILIPQEEEYQNELQKEINQTLAEYNLDFETDIKPLFGEKTETIVAIGGELTADTPDVYIIQKLENLEKYTELANKLLSQKLTVAIENGYKSKNTNETDDILFFGEKNGFLVLTNNETEFSETMRLSVGDSLIYNEKYVKIRENLPANFLGLAYVNMELIALEIKNMLLQTEGELDESTLTTLDNPWIEILSSIGASINAEQNGIKFLAYTHGNKAVMEKLDYRFNDIPNQETYLNKSLPGNELYLYMEGFDLKQKIEDFEEGLQETNPEAYELYEEQKKQAKAILGFDIDKDILTWLDKAIAFSVQNTESVIPGITLAVDVSSNPEGAGKLVDTIDSFLAIAMLSLKDYATSIDKQDIEIGGNKFKQLAVLTENLPLELQEQGDLIVPILADLKVSYGITNNDILIFSTYPDLAKDFQKDVVTENVIYKLLSKETDKKGQGVFYFSPETFAKHLEQIKLTMEDFSSLSASDQKDIEVIIDYLQSLQGMIFTGVAHTESSDAQGYLRINK